MTRLEDFLSNGDGSVYVPEFPEDIHILRDNIDKIKNLSDFQIEVLYSRYSEQDYCANWLCLTPGIIQDFNNWLNEEI